MALSRRAAPRAAAPFGPRRLCERSSWTSVLFERNTRAKTCEEPEEGREWEKGEGRVFHIHTCDRASHELIEYCGTESQLGKTNKQQ